MCALEPKDEEERVAGRNLTTIHNVLNNSGMLTHKDGKLFEITREQLAWQIAVAT